MLLLLCEMQNKRENTGKKTLPQWFGFFFGTGNFTFGNFTSGKVSETSACDLSQKQGKQTEGFEILKC